MPVTLTPTPVGGNVTVPGTTELEFAVHGLGSRKLDVVVLYTVMDNAAIRISSGASSMRTIGGRNLTVRQSIGLDRTDGPTPGAFRVKAALLEDGKPLAECTWNLQVHNTAVEQAQKALANVAPDAPYVPLPDDDEIAALADRADRSAARKKAAKKAATKKAPAKKAGAKKSAAKKTTAKKSAAKKSAAKKSAAKKGATKKAAAKKAPAKKAATKKKAVAKKRPAAKKKTAAKKKSARR